MLNSLRVDVDALGDDLKTVNGKLGNIMSLLMEVASGQATPVNPNCDGCVKSGDSGSDFEDGNDGSAAAAPNEAIHAGLVGFQQWGGRGGENDRGGRRRGQDSYGFGTSLGHREAPPFPPTDHPRQGLQDYPLYLWPSQKFSSTERYSAGPHEVCKQIYWCILPFILCRGHRLIDDIYFSIWGTHMNPFRSEMCAVAASFSLREMLSHKKQNVLL